MTRIEGQNELQQFWFRARLAAEKAKADVEQKVKQGGADFVLLDARDRESYERDHLPGALSMSIDELGELSAELDPAKEYVVYCWHRT